MTDTGVKCPRCEYQFDYSELPWTDDDRVEECPSCDGEIYIQPDITVRHKVALSIDEIDFADPV